MKKLQDRVAIITGAGGGFGEGIAKHFAELGAKVVVADLRAEAAQQVAAAIESAGGQAIAVHVDVTQDASVADMVAAAVKRFGRLDILVNNAGTTHKNQPMLETDEKTFDRVYATNVKSIYLGARHAVPLFRQQGGGVIINIASTAGLRPRPGLSWYAGTKGAAITLTKAMAVELAPDKIRVNAINPVMGETGLLADFLPGADSEEVRQKIIATIPLGRLSKPIDIAKATAFLASDEADFITGVALEVDGGRCI
ncbi:SDR family oxidoreductase [Polaromonas sp. JS666]|uniref:SDR family oxidoreductase n=1 Tax=Polaromonas sp. (strain JS666 / ATCC BAA-500) TaxID=296591 RepID=UPI0000463C85|nr:SDR family oxidoreductase [Polaromonas sp. JS666]ABE42059.1 short-chain dehydrogenase/reductase SDR [Polaromonas sp. JS666]